MITKEKLADLAMGYCISMMEIGGRTYCISASEARDGQIVLIDVQTRRVQKIEGLAGGVMSILPVPEEQGTFLAIQRFYPVFDSQAAEIVCCRLSSLEGDVLQAQVEPVVSMPYVHRIALTGKPGARKIVAAALCCKKDFVDDWSSGGIVKEYRLDGALRCIGERLLLEGIHKNHGMYLYEQGGQSLTLVAGEEGVWSVDGEGNTEKLCDEAVSDLCLYDVDGDGEDEMVCIAPFHGNTLKVLKRTVGGWSCLYTAPLEFGHAVWCGPCGGKPVILSCSRAGDRCTRLYRPTWEDGQLQVQTQNVELDVGASNIAVDVQPDGIVLYAANHGVNETARYTII